MVRHGSGYRDDGVGQTFSAAAYKAAGKKWQILDIDESTGEITLISDVIYQDNTTDGVSDGTMGNEGFYLSNGIGYIWAEEELHRIGAIYGYGYGADTSKTITYYYGGPYDQDGSITAGTVEAQQGRKATLSLGSGGRAITVEDINKICGKDTTYTANYYDNLNTKKTYNAKYYPTLDTINETTGRGTIYDYSGDYYDTMYYYTVYSANKDSTAAEAQNRMIKIGEEYWIGSRGVYSATTYTEFSVKYISGDSSAGTAGQWMCACDDGTWEDNFGWRGVRAVVTLKTEIQTGDLTYNESTGWTLV